jgi:hypothetical protein
MLDRLKVQDLLFLTLRDHGKVFVADLPNLSDGQLAHISKEANEVLNSLEKKA